MKIYSILLLIIVFSINVFSKPPKEKRKKNKVELEEIVIKPVNEFSDYQASRTRNFDLLHTKIEIEPVVNQKVAKGKATLTLTPYFYPQQTLMLDAKYMKINNVFLKQQQLTHLSYTYDSLVLKIDLGNTYHQNDTITIEIDYIAQPYSIGQEVVDADGRGMYFINVDNKNPYKPFHIWTQGEIEASSFWFPTIDAPNERCTQEIFVTLDTAYISLSNGLLMSSETKGGKRTDYWKQDIPHASYLFFLAFGDYKKYHTTWNNIDVDYYTFKKYFDDVNGVFGNTPEMLSYFSDLLGVKYPWDKLAQIIAYDYTAGAMENSSAILYFDRLLANRQDLIDDNFDWIIAHEMFHHWFGNLVTAESWANLTLNESFADYSEYLWAAHKYGKDDADAYGERSLGAYLSQFPIKNDALVHYFYKVPKDNFDAIRYSKGGRILHMLRNYVGDDAFFKALNVYLIKNQYNSAEVSDFREVVEAITGEDLNWFFNQWYFSKGHPKLDIKYTYYPENQNIEIKIKQTQNKNDAPIFKLPSYVDIYYKDTVRRERIVLIDKESTFYFASKEKPLFVNFDPEGVLLAEITENLSDEEQVLKFEKTTAYKHRYNVLHSVADKIKDSKTIQNLFLKAIQHPDWNTQRLALSLIGNQIEVLDKNTVEAVLKDMIFNHKKPIIRKMALETLNMNDKNAGFEMAKYMIEKDSSIQCLAAALGIIQKKNYNLAYQNALKFLDTENPLMLSTVGNILKDTAVNHVDFLKKAIWLNTYRSAYQNFENMSDFLIQTKDTAIFKDAAQFLLDINHYEESDYNFYGANKTLYSLKNTLERPQNNKKAGKEEQAMIKTKLEILSGVISELRDDE
jgi:aminopeptidase N